MARKISNIPLNPLRTFAVAAQNLNFSAAARELGVSQVAVSRQVAVVEDYLKTRLFERSNNVVKLTDAGRELSRQIAPLFFDIEAATLDFRDRERRHVVNLRSYSTLTYQWLIPGLRAFNRQQPSFDLRLDTRVSPLDFHGTQLDLAIQLGHGDWPDTDSRKLFDEEIDAVCSPDYAEFSADRAWIDDAVLLHSRYRRREWQDWAEAASISIENLTGLQFESSLFTYRAAQSGLGVAMAQLELIESELANGSLVQPFNLPLKTGAAFWLVWPSKFSVSPMTRKLIDWILQQAGQETEFGSRFA